MKVKMFDYPHYVEVTLAESDKLWITIMWATTTLGLVWAVMVH